MGNNSIPLSAFSTTDMAYTQNKDGTISITGWEKGIAPSPHFGIANLQNVNIYTETGEVMCNYARVMQTNASAGISGTLTYVNSTTLTSNKALIAGTWITVSGYSGSGLADGNYYVVQVMGFSVKLATTFKGSVISGYTAGSGSYSTFTNLAKPIATTTPPEQYRDYNGTLLYRYYVLDSAGYVWVYDTGDANNSNGLTWACIDITPATNGSILPNGIAVYNGYLFVFAGNTIYYKETLKLGQAADSTGTGWATMTSTLNSPNTTNNPHFAFVGHQSKLYYTDGDVVGSIYATSNSQAGQTGVPNLWSYGTATFNGSTADLTTTAVAGDIPTVGQLITFDSTGSMPTGLSRHTAYYVTSVVRSAEPIVIQVSATIGGGAITPNGGSGTLIYNSFNPAGTLTTVTYVLSTHALTLPTNEISQSLAELGNNLVIGTKSSALYLWDQYSQSPNSFILLPERNTPILLTVNNVVYAFTGNKGNVYVTTGSIASTAFTIPDYTTGMIEPYFYWQSAMYVRGRVWFGVQQGSGTSNIGGIWSFIPTQNFYMGTAMPEQGIALRIENQNSYGTYAGATTVLIPAMDQTAQGVQYWSGWQDGSGHYGIDVSGTAPQYLGSSYVGIIETDIIPVGNYTDRGNFAGIEYKLGAPLQSGESIQILYRTNLSFDAFTSIQTDYTSTIPTPYLSNRLKVPFANVQWIQFQVIISGSSSATGSYVRLRELLLYKKI